MSLLELARASQASQVSAPMPVRDATPEICVRTRNNFPWPPRPRDLHLWSIPMRQRWGELANRLEDQGIPWPDHEQQAYEQIKAECG